MSTKHATAKVVNQLERQHALLVQAPDPVSKLAALKGLRARVTEAYGGGDPSAEIETRGNDFASSGMAYFLRFALGVAPFMAAGIILGVVVSPILFAALLPAAPLGLFAGFILQEVAEWPGFFGAGRVKFRKDFGSVKNARRLYKLRGALDRSMEGVETDIRYRELEARAAALKEEKAACPQTAFNTAPQKAVSRSIVSRLGAYDI